MPTYDYFPFDSGLGANSTESRWREMMRKMKTTGIVAEGTGMTASDNCAVSDGSGMQIEIEAGKAWVRGHFFSHTGTPATLAINSNSSGSTRTDLVVIRADFVNNTIQYQVLQGTTTPVQNANTWDLPLANVAVPNGAVSASSFTFTDRRVFATFSTLAPSVRKDGVNFTLANNIFTSVNLSGATDWITQDTMYSGTDNTRLICTQDGFYLLYGSATFGGPSGAPSVAAPRRIIRFMVNGTAVVGLQQIYAPNMAIGLSTTAMVRLFAGDYVQFQVYQECGAGITTGMSTMHAALHYLNSNSIL
jgi:hypothetical protein